MLYDADCGICSAAARLVRRRATVSAVAIQSPGGAALLADLDPATRLDAFHVVASTGERWTGGAALAPLARELPGGRAIAPLLERFPTPAAAAYGLVARNRQRLSRWLGLTACEPRRGPGA
jgi:predicted DCC family thiol-disulfide oxidoreductase YuxK